MSKTRLFTLALTLVVVSVGCWWLAVPGEQPPPLVQFPRLAPAPTKLLRGVYLLGGVAPNASYVVETSAGLVLVDTCLESNADPIKRQLATLKLDIGQLQAILLTHAHGDHSLGANHLRELSGAKVYAGRGDCDVLRAGGPREAFFSVFPTGVDLHPTEIDYELSGGEAIEIGDARFTVIATPGHTPGSVCYLLERDKLRMLFAGDVIASLAEAGPYSELGTYSARLSPRYRGSATDFAISLRKLLELPVPDLVLPGHPRTDRTPQRPQLSQEQWQSLLGKGIAAMETLSARYAKDGLNFLDGKRKQLLPGLHYWGNFHGFALYGLITPSKKLFLFDAPGGEGLWAEIQTKLGQTDDPTLKPTAVLLTSCHPEAMRGLKHLVEQTHCEVFGPGPESALAAVRKVCPPGTKCRRAEALEKMDWFPAQALPLYGQRSASVAYLITWLDSKVLVSGRVPIEIGRDASDNLRRVLAGPGGDAERYRRSLEDLRRLAPDLWLPAVPVHEQNAFQYDADWQDRIHYNQTLFQSLRTDSTP